MAFDPEDLEVAECLTSMSEEGVWVREPSAAGCHKVLQRGNAVARHNIFCEAQNGKC